MGSPAPDVAPLPLPAEPAQKEAPRPPSRQLTPHVRVQPWAPGELEVLRAEPWPALAPAAEPAPQLDAPPGDEAKRLQRALSEWLLHAPAPGSRVAPSPASPGPVQRGETPVTAQPEAAEREAAQQDAAKSQPGAGLSGPAALEGSRGAEVKPPAPQPALAAAPGPEPRPGTPPALGDDLTPLLEPMFEGASPFLARFLPRSAPQQLGLLGRFCPFDSYLGHLHDQGWSGYLQVGTGQLAAYALLHEGRVVAAATLGATGEEALGELLTLYKHGAALAAYPLPPVLAHLLSGVGGRASRPELSADFTGVYADAEGALFYSRGEVVATISATLPAEGAFPAPARPPALGLPRSLAGWAYQTYALTLRGRDVDHPITSVYHEVRAKYGEEGAAFVRALGRGQTPAEYAAHSDRALPELEKRLQEFAALGLLRAPEA